MSSPRRQGSARTRARRAAVQALYQWQVGGATPGEIERQFRAEPALRSIDSEYFHELLHGVPGCIRELDAALEPALDRPIEQVDPVERAILRLGVYELVHRLDVPWRVVINEAVELARMFGAEQSHRYVNGILDRVARRARAPEIGRSSGAAGGA